MEFRLIQRTSVGILYRLPQRLGEASNGVAEENMGGQYESCCLTTGTESLIRAIDSTVYIHTLCLSHTHTRARERMHARISEDHISHVRASATYLDRKACKTKLHSIT